MKITVQERWLVYTRIQTDNIANATEKQLVGPGEIREWECVNVKEPTGPPRSHLFTIRVWEELLGAEQSEWRGKVQLLTNGDARYFRDWATLVPLLLTMLSESEPDIPRGDN